jgi:saccharopine dehydrogenase-like NADP-dependent oxidoreductase
MKKNVMIIGAGGVAHVAAHKAAMNNDILGDICIASRTQAKCDAIIDNYAPLNTYPHYPNGNTILKNQPRKNRLSTMQS